jgi:hypothetical protein
MYQTMYQSVWYATGRVGWYVFRAAAGRGSVGGVVDGVAITLLRRILAHPALLLSRHTAPFLTRSGIVGVSLTGQHGLRTDCDEEDKRKEKSYATLYDYAHF